METTNARKVEPIAYGPLELSKALSISVGFARQLIARGEIKSYRAGRRILVRKEDAEKWLKRQPSAAQAISAKG